MHWFLIVIWFIQILKESFYWWTRMSVKGRCFMIVSRAALACTLVFVHPLFLMIACLRYFGELTFRDMIFSSEVLQKDDEVIETFLVKNQVMNTQATRAFFLRQTFFVRCFLSSIFF